MPAKFDQYVLQLNFNLAPSPSFAEGFSPYFLVEEPEFDSGEVVSVFSPDDVSETWADYTKELVELCFRQNKTATPLQLVGVGEGEAEESPGQRYLDAAQALQDEFVPMLCMQSIDPAEKEPVALFCELNDIIFVPKTEGVFGDTPGPEFEDVEDWVAPIEVGEYDDEEWPDGPPEAEAAVARFLAADPDRNAKPFQTIVVGVDSTGLELPMGNLALEEGWNFFSDDRQDNTWLTGGTTVSRRQVAELIGVLVFKQRFLEALAAELVRLDSEDGAFPISAEGQEMVGTLAFGVYDRLAGAGHFVEGGFEDRDEEGNLPEITPDHIASGTLPIEFRLQHQTGALRIGGDVNFQRQAIT